MFEQLFKTPVAIDRHQSLPFVIERQVYRA
jgi:hypothetical protein